MEILNNFSSIYCFIAFVIGAMFMLITFCIAAMGKMTEPTNKVHFYVARDKNGTLWLYMGKPIRVGDRFMINSCSNTRFLGGDIENYGLDYKDYANLKWEDEPVEVFINMED